MIYLYTFSDALICLDNSRYVQIEFSKCFVRVFKHRVDQPTTESEAFLLEL